MIRRSRIVRILDWLAALLTSQSRETWSQVTQADVDAGIERWARE